MDDLVRPDDLTGFPGAPFSPAVVAAAAAAVRDECGWHIAPTITTTARVRPVGKLLFLRTLHLIDVEAVTDSGGEDVEVEDVEEGTGIVVLKRAPRGRVGVEFTHGYEKCPPALLGVIAERAQRIARGSVRQESAGSLSVTYESSNPRPGVQAAGDSSAGVLARYTLPGRP